MTLNDDLLISMLAGISGDSPGEADLDRRVARFRAGVRRLHEDPGEAARIDLIAAFAGPRSPREARRLASRRMLSRSAGSHRLAASAAALVLVAGAAYGLTAVAGTGGRPAPGGRAVAVPAGLAAVTGCPGIKGAVGTLERVSGSSLTLQTGSGQSVTVATSGSTRVTRLVKGSVSDLSEGERVLVSGTDNDGTLVAASVSPLPGPAALPDNGYGPAGQSLGQILLLHGHALGTVTGISGSGLTVQESDGTRVPVTTSGSTSVITQARASLGQLRTGEQTAAVGTVGSDGTLAASAVEQLGVSLSELSPGARRLPSGPPGSSSRWRSSGSCSSGSVATGALLPGA